ncbi:uncharacterized protein LOC130636882 [Hydractinia symbiolongicarpus]|uniref:uncharacterized protein LOC130636882 n=1 Tax=Hydractinia symbiolongicarpus TaxID=13093 RepID=UPI00254B0907|nr:uncharacterized protein LOC130636882 [Hydractinia symbiolongicarpus]
MYGIICISSLYTNVPIKDTLCIIRELLLNDDEYDKLMSLVEKKNNDTPPFLDTPVSRDGGNLSVSVYRKSTHTDQYLNHTSYHQMFCKESVVSSSLDRAVNVVSGENDRKKDLSQINNALLANTYSRRSIKKVEEKTRNRTDKNGDRKDADEPAAIYTVISESQNTLKSKCNIFYEIPCKDCDAVYVGETKRMFKQRVQEHKRAVRNADTDKNEIADHSWNNDHIIDWDNKKIIDELDSKKIERNHK